ncbi:MAG: 4-phosphopantetheinyl transferase [Myxococcales bacterium]|nr:4-phosphopantetheinyl transferase [Myxococcales bacterium]
MLISSADVHLWLFEGAEDAPQALADRCATLLSDDETGRMLRFRVAADRRRYLFAHALVRAVLSRYWSATPPTDWRFVTNPQGRPEIAPGLASLPLRFNLSHTEGLVACAVALGRDVGVDVEHIEPPVLDLGIADHCFAPSEVRGLMAQPESARRERFFAIWTLKEAYIKARGLGLSLPLDKFAFELPALAITIDPALNDDAAHWHFEQRSPTPLHRLALAVRRAPHERLNVSLQPRADVFPTG